MHITEKLNAQDEYAIRCSCNPGLHIVRLVAGAGEEINCRHCGESKTHDALLKEYADKMSQKGNGYRWPTCFPGYNCSLAKY